MHALRPRLAFLAVALLAATSLPLAAQTANSPDAAPAGSPKPTAGIISGQVIHIDYQRGLLGVLSGGRTVEVTVLPSTNIAGKGGGYHSIAEISRGAWVEIFTSSSEGKITAQIIRLK